MESVISRSYGERETTGCWYIFDGDRSIFNCKVIELPMKGNQHGISCILPGTYDVEKYKDLKKGWVFLLLNVPGRSGVEVHIGNYAAGKKIDTRGCILPGLRFVDINHDGNLDVADSTKAMNALMAFLPDKFKLHILDDETKNP